MQKINEQISAELKNAIRENFVMINDNDITKGTIVFKNADNTTYMKQFKTIEERRNLLCEWACNNDDLRETFDTIGHNETYIIIKES